MNVNVIPKLVPIDASALIRPTFRRWDLVRENRRDAWIHANDDLLRQYYRATGSSLETPPEDTQAAWTVFCDIQFEREYAHFEELKFERDYAYEGATNAVNWEET